MFPIYVISMERSTKRREIFYENWENNDIKNIEWIHAIDGNTADFSKWDIDRKRFHRFWHNPISCCSYNTYYSNNEYGCAISHISIYQKIVNEKIPYALIVEDDALLKSEFSNIVKNLDEIIKSKDLDLLYLYCDDRLHSFSKPEKIGVNLNNVFIKRIGVPGWDWFFNRRKIVYTTAAYVITYEGAKKILSKAFPIRLQADRLLGLMAYNKLIAYKFVPNLIYISNEPTTIPLTDELIKLNKKPWYSRMARKIKNLYHD